MTQEALRMALEALEGFIPYLPLKDEAQCNRYDKAITAIKEALAQPEQDTMGYWKEHAQGMQRDYDSLLADYEKLAQTEQEPVAWQWLDTAHFRKKLPKDAGDGVWNPLYAAPQRTERPVDCERCNRLEEQAYDLVGKLRVANIKLSMQPQRTWVDLTDEDISEIVRGTHNTGSFVRAIEAKLKEKNT